MTSLPSAERESTRETTIGEFFFGGFVLPFLFFFHKGGGGGGGGGVGGGKKSKNHISVGIAIRQVVVP